MLSLKDPIKDILRKEDDFKNTCINSFPSKDEALINSVIPSPKIGLNNGDIMIQKDIFNTSLNDLPLWDIPLDNVVGYSLTMSLPHKDSLFQEEIVNIYFKDLPLKDEALKINGDPSPRESLSHVDPLVIEDDMIFPTNIVPSFNNFSSRDETIMPTSSLSTKIDPIHDKILVQEETINTSFGNIYHMNYVHPSKIHKATLEKENDVRLQGFDIPKPSSINMIHVNGYETPNNPFFIVQGSSPSPNKPLSFFQGGYNNYSFFTPNKQVITMQGVYPTKRPYEYAKQIT